MVLERSPRAAERGREYSPYVERSREDWAELAEQTPITLDPATLERVRGLGDPTSMLDVREVYLPLTRLLSRYFTHTSELHRSTNDFLQLQVGRTPFVIAIAGSVAVGKSTTARLLRLLLARWPQHPRVELVTTDGFLLPNAELTARGLMQRKGFPESYDRRALLRFVTEVKAGRAEVHAPVYSHLVYDIVPGEPLAVRRPDILLLEGLNVLQPAPPPLTGQAALAVSDFIDFSVYVDAATEDIRRWYLERFRRLRETAFRNPESYFRRYAELPEAEALVHAEEIWDQINRPNLERNIMPTRGRANLVLRKGPDHTVSGIRLRKV
jgi:type I pantothenate kinase